LLYLVLSFEAQLFPQLIHSPTHVDSVGGTIDNPDFHSPNIIIIPSFNSSL